MSPQDWLALLADRRASREDLEAAANEAEDQNYHLIAAALRREAERRR
jgi:hypothetical protein